jgi:glycosyltransferase involved in cell wall biosynthesis
MRIVFLNPISDIGGAERSLLAWMNATRVAFPAAELTLILPDENGALVNVARDAGITVAAVALPSSMARLGDSGLIGSRTTVPFRFVIRTLFALPGAFGYIRRLRRALRTIRPDLIHSNGIKPQLLARLALLGRRTPPVVTWHIHDFLGQRPLMGRGLRWAARPVAAAVAVSEAVAKDARLVLPNTHIDVVYNATDLDRFSPQAIAGERLDELAGLSPTTPETIRVVLVATYARWKGHDVFLRAAAAAMHHLPSLRFYIVGGPIYRTGGSQFTRKELDAQMTHLGLGERVGFVPFQADPSAVYQSADVIVHASTRPEPFGLTVIEAMACGKPVIVSQAGGAAELFTPNVDGIGVPPGDADQLAAAMVKLAGDSDLRGQLGANARRTVEQRFDQRQLPQRVAAFYQPFVLGRSGPS